MIKIYCKESDEPYFTRCICYDTSTSTCDAYDNKCDECPYYDCNIQFIHHDLDRIIIEASIKDLDIKTCLFNTFYNYIGCGVVDYLNKNETCSDCRFWYDNIEVIEVRD